MGQPFSLYEKALFEACQDLASKIQYLLDNYIELPEGCFTFPDGDTWHKTDDKDYEGR